jgi:hypothetical protein
MTLLQKWLTALVGLGAGYLVLTNPESFYKATTGIRNLTAGSIVAVTSGGQKGLN